MTIKVLMEHFKWNRLGNGVEGVEYVEGGELRPMATSPIELCRNKAITRICPPTGRYREHRVRKFHFAIKFHFRSPPYGSPHSLGLWVSWSIEYEISSQVRSSHMVDSLWKPFTQYRPESPMFMQFSSRQSLKPQEVKTDCRLYLSHPCVSRHTSRVCRFLRCSEIKCIA